MSDMLLKRTSFVFTQPKIGPFGHYVYLGRNWGRNGDLIMQKGEEVKPERKFFSLQWREKTLYRANFVPVKQAAAKILLDKLAIPNEFNPAVDYLKNMFSQILPPEPQARLSFLFGGIVKQNNPFAKTIFDRELGVKTLFEELMKTDDMWVRIGSKVEDKQEIAKILKYEVFSLKLGLASKYILKPLGAILPISLGGLIYHYTENIFYWLIGTGLSMFFFPMIVGGISRPNYRQTMAQIRNLQAMM